MFCTKYIDYSSINRLAYAVSFLLISISIVTLSNVEISGYETSFYQNIPLITFIALALAYVLVWIPLFHIKGPHPDDLILTLVFSSLYTFVVSSLWQIKYHRFYGIGDPYIHLTSIAEMISSGRINADEVLYPALHMLLTTITGCTGADLASLYTLAHPVGSVLFVLLTFTVSLSIVPSKKVQQIILLLAPLNPMIMDNIGVLIPYTLSILFLLFSLSIFFKNISSENWSWNWKLLLLLGGGILLISHIFTMIFYLCVIIGMLTYARIPHPSLRELAIKQNKYLIYVAFLVLITVFWVVYTSSFAFHIFDGILDVLANVFNEQLSHEQMKISSRSLSDLLFKRFNLISQTALVALICTGVLYLVIVEKKRDKTLLYLVFLIIYFIVSAFLFLFNKALLSSEFGVYGRYVYLASLIYPLYIGLGGYEILMFIREKVSIPRSLPPLFLILMLFFTLLSICAIYPDPSTGYYSAYTTENTLSGMQWSFEKIDSDTSKVMGGGDHFEALALYMFGKDTYSMYYGSTNGMLNYLGLDHTLYMHRGVHTQYDSKGKKEYVFYEPFMAYFLANPRYTTHIATVNEHELEIKRDLNKIYKNGDFTIHELIPIFSRS